MKSNETEADKANIAIASNLIQDALNRMRRAAERDTGCHLTADMIHALSVTAIGEMWWQDDPRKQS